LILIRNLEIIQNLWLHVKLDGYASIVVLLIIHAEVYNLGNNMLGKMVTCACCGEKVKWEDAERTGKRSSTRVRYFCGKCSKKEVLVYQPFYKVQRRAYKYKVVNHGKMSSPQI